MQIKWKRVLNFTKSQKYCGGSGLDAVYSEIRDEPLINYVVTIAEKYNCDIKEVHLRSGPYAENYIALRTTNENFLNFVRDFCEHFNGYLENVDF